MSVLSHQNRGDLMGQYKVHADKLPKRLPFEKQILCLFGNSSAQTHSLRLTDIKEFQQDFAYGRHPREGYLLLTYNKNADTPAVLTLFDAQEEPWKEVFNYEIPNSYAKQILASFPDKTIEKQSCSLTYGTQNWDLEKFTTPDGEIIIANTSNNNTISSQHRPKWLGKEISVSQEISARSLILKTTDPFQKNRPVSRYFHLTPNAFTQTPSTQKIRRATFPSKSAILRDVTGHYSLELLGVDAQSCYVLFEKHELSQDQLQFNGNYHLELELTAQDAALYFYPKKNGKTQWEHGIKKPLKDLKRVEENLFKRCDGGGHEFHYFEKAFHGITYQIYQCLKHPEISYASCQTDSKTSPISPPPWIIKEIPFEATISRRQKPDHLPYRPIKGRSL